MRRALCIAARARAVRRARRDGATLVARSLARRARARWRNYQRFETLPPDRRQHLEDRYQRFRQMPPDEQNRLRRNYDQYRGLPRPSASSSSASTSAGANASAEHRYR